MTIIKNKAKKKNASQAKGKASNNITLNDSCKVANFSVASTASSSPCSDSRTVSYVFADPFLGGGVSVDLKDAPRTGNGALSVAAPVAAPEPQKAAIERPRITPDIGPDPGCGQCRVSFETVFTQNAVEGIRFDFAFGYRIHVPENAPRDNYTVRIFDNDSEMQIGELTMKPGETVVGERKYFVRYRLEIYSGEEQLFVHNYDCAGRRVYVVIPDGGLGDNLAWLPIVNEFRRVSKADVCCVMGEWMIRLAGDLYPGLSFVPLGTTPRLTGAYANYYCGIFGKENLSWRPIAHQHLGMQGAVEAILGLPQQPMKCRLHTGSRRPFSEPYVCISTMATNPGKYWNFPDGWNQIIRMLKKFGYRVLDIDRDRELEFAGKRYTIPSEAEDFTGLFPIQERIELLEHAEFFIGLPSGLSWLAWNVDIPVVMLVGFTLANCEFPTPYRVTNFLFCHGCWNDSTCFFDQHVPVWCPRHVGTPREIECTKAITPKMVRDTIYRIPAFQKRLAEVTMAQDKEAFDDAK